MECKYNYNTNNCWLSKSQKRKIEHIINICDNCHGKYNDNYELRDLSVTYLSDTIHDVVCLYFVNTYKTHATTAFGEHIQVFINRRGKVTYYHVKSDSIKTFTGDNAYTLICASHSN